MARACVQRKRGSLSPMNIVLEMGKNHELHKNSLCIHFASVRACIGLQTSTDFELRDDFSTDDILQRIVNLIFIKLS